MIVLTGIDLASVSDISALAADSFARDRVWTAQEQLSHEGYPERRAGQWAAKEAVMKVLGEGIGRIAPTDIEITCAEGERPQVLLHGPALALSQTLGITSLAISITHEQGAASAVAVALAKRAGNL